MDYKELLKKYMAHIKQCEGIDYLDYINDGWGSSDVKFTDEEIKELKNLAE